MDIDTKNLNLNTTGLPYSEEFRKLQINAFSTAIMAFQSQMQETGEGIENFFKPDTRNATAGMLMTEFPVVNKSLVHHLTDKLSANTLDSYARQARMNYWTVRNPIVTGQGYLKINDPNDFRPIPQNSVPNMPAVDICAWYPFSMRDQYTHPDHIDAPFINTFTDTFPHFYEQVINAYKQAGIDRSTPFGQKSLLFAYLWRSSFFAWDKKVRSTARQMTLQLLQQGEVTSEFIVDGVNEGVSNRICRNQQSLPLCRCDNILTFFTDMFRLFQDQSNAAYNFMGNSRIYMRTITAHMIAQRIYGAKNSMFILNSSGAISSLTDVLIQDFANRQIKIVLDDSYVTNPNFSGTVGESASQKIYDIAVGQMYVFAGDNSPQVNTDSLDQGYLITQPIASTDFLLKEYFKQAEGITGIHPWARFRQQDLGQVTSAITSVAEMMFQLEVPPITPTSIAASRMQHGVPVTTYHKATMLTMGAPYINGNSFLVIDLDVSNCDECMALLTPQEQAQVVGFTSPIGFTSQVSSTNDEVTATPQKQRGRPKAENVGDVNNTDE